MRVKNCRDRIVLWFDRIPMLVCNAVLWRQTVKTFVSSVDDNQFRVYSHSDVRPGSGH